MDKFKNNQNSSLYHFNPRKLQHLSMYYRRMKGVNKFRIETEHLKKMLEKQKEAYP